MRELTLPVAPAWSVEGQTATYRIVKRCLDILVAGAVLILALPLLSLLSIAVWLDSPGSVFLGQPRLGRRGRTFRMWKVRTMRPGAEDALEDVFRESPGLRLDWLETQKLIHDPRLTRIGAYLRRSSVDELPQLWNVLLGQMTLVGPRPILPEQRELYGEGFSAYAAVRPGMTGLWQVRGRNLLSFAERARLDAEYLDHRSLGLDAQILWRTIDVVVHGIGAF